MYLLCLRNLFILCFHLFIYCLLYTYHLIKIITVQNHSLQYKFIKFSTSGFDYTVTLNFDRWIFNYLTRNLKLVYYLRISYQFILVFFFSFLFLTWIHWSVNFWHKIDSLHISLNRNLHILTIDRDHDMSILFCVSKLLVLKTLQFLRKFDIFNIISV